MFPRYNKAGATGKATGRNDVAMCQISYTSCQYGQLDEAAELASRGDKTGTRQSNRRQKAHFRRAGEKKCVKIYWL